MMSKIRNFFVTALLGGVAVILPGALVVMVFGWLFSKFSMIITPITQFIISQSQIQTFLADTIAFAAVIIFCFIVGLVAKTKIGNFLFDIIDLQILQRVPGYGLIKETVTQLLGAKKNPFGQVALVTLFPEIKATGFITDEHEDGTLTVFVPTGPNPTTGGIFHLPAKFVERIDAPTEQTMRSIISCGAGSKELLKFR